MPDAPPAPTLVRRQATIALFAGFVVLSLVSTLQSFLAARAADEARPLGQMVLFAGLTWVVWLAFAPAIVWLGRRFDFARGRRALSLAVHVLAATTLYVTSMLLLVWIGVTMFNPEEAITWAMLRQSLLASSRLTLVLVLYATILLVDRALRLWQELGAREMQAARLEALASRARLDALASRLHPHFLFNALQSVSALVDEDPPRARAMLALIGDLLRDALADNGEVMVPLGEEVRLLRRYLAIEEIRFADRLRVELAVDDGVQDLRVPRFLLQPLAENAIRHGLAPRPEGGVLRISGTRVPGGVRLAVWNDGEPLPAVLREGVGLATTRERLAAQFGGRAQFALGAMDGGVGAVLEIPE
jgi:sensor histidine kinase YesM